MANSSAHQGEASGPQSSIPASETKRCPICGEAIWVDARKCVHCDSDLTWRSYLTFSTTTLALLTALFTVIGVGYPGLVQFFTPNNSKLSGYFFEMGTSGETISMYYENNGAKVGAITRMWLKIAYQLSNQPRHFYVIPHTQTEVAYFLRGGEQNSAVYYIDNTPKTYWKFDNEKSSDLQTAPDNACERAKQYDVPPRPINAKDDPHPLPQADLQFLLSEDSWNDNGPRCMVGISGVNNNGSACSTQFQVSCPRQVTRMFQALQPANGGASTTQ